MQFGTDGFDLWVFHRQETEPRYLLLHTSQEKADKWFNGGRFWQILGGPIQENEDIGSALLRPLHERGLDAKGIWAAEHTYIIYNRRRSRMEMLPVFAAEVTAPLEIPLTWEHSEYGWYTLEECMQRIHFRGLREGLQWTRKYISDVSEPARELRIV
jgi:hypothetical protein